MSRAYLGPQAAAKVTSFERLIPAATDSAKGDVRGTKLGRTASAVEATKAVAKAEGFAIGHAEGYAAGLANGRAEGMEAAFNEEIEGRREAVAEFRDELNQSAETVLTAVYEWFAQAEESLASIAMLIAARIVARELTSTEDVALAITREALAEVTHAESARIRVNPFSAPALESQRDVLLGLSPSLKGIEIVDDPAILGGCVVESAGGVIDATLETRIAGILAEIREHFAAPPEQRVRTKPKKVRATRTKGAESVEAA